MSERKFYVIGGEYADTNFTRIADDMEEERHGPFSEREARDFWRSITAKTVDNAMVRYRIRPAEPEQADSWYVAGGEYADFSFSRIAAGRKLETYGPFPRAEALAVWRAITAKTVDDALTRYQIVTPAHLDQLKAEA